MYFLVVYLHETALYQMFLLVLVIDECNNMIECSRNNTFELFRGVSAHHREGFTTTGLSVGEDGPIIPLNHTINKWEGSFLVYLALSWSGIEHVVKGKGFALRSASWMSDADLVVFAIDVCDNGAIYIEDGLRSCC